MVATETVRDHVANAAQMVLSLLEVSPSGRDVVVLRSTLFGIETRLNAALTLLDQQESKG